MTVQIYSDDTSCNERTFQIIASIWGTPENCKNYSQEVDTIIKGNNKLGTDFKGLHSYKLNDKNWSTLGVKFEKVIEKLFEYVDNYKLDLKITLVSNYRFESNAGYLKNLIKAQLENRSSVIGKQFQSLEDKDLPALYHRIDQLFVYLLYRDRFGEEGDEFEFYPDSTGKILSYNEKKFPVSGNLPVEWPLKFYELVLVLGNSLAKVINLTGWPVKKQELIKFKPLKWTESYLIQSCDILANFTLNHLRFQVGLTDKKYKLKSEALLKHFLLDEHDEDIKKTFSINSSGDDVICTDQGLLVTIDAIKNKN